MPRKDLTEIVIIVDRSGSMNNIRADAEGGVNSFIVEQRSAAGQALATLVEFDTTYDFVCRGVDVHAAPTYRLVPRGGTALLDAVGRTITETEARLQQIPEAERADTVVFLVVTDGHENSSKEFTKEQVRALIDKRRELDQWQFIFLGADDKSWDDAAAMGVPVSNFAAYAPQNVAAAYANVSGKLRSVRAGKLSGTMDDLEAARAMCFTGDDKASLKAAPSASGATVTTTTTTTTRK